jgi:hypothetical protein
MGYGGGVKIQCRFVLFSAGLRTLFLQIFIAGEGAEINAHGHSTLLCFCVIRGNEKKCRAWEGTVPAGVLCKKVLYIVFMWLYLVQKNQCKHIMLAR